MVILQPQFLLALLQKSNSFLFYCLWGRPFRKNIFLTSQPKNIFNHRPDGMPRCDPRCPVRAQFYTLRAWAYSWAVGMGMGWVRAVHTVAVLGP